MEIYFHKCGNFSDSSYTCRKFSESVENIIKSEHVFPNIFCTGSIHYIMASYFVWNMLRAIHKISVQ